jgi:hypothetical protein
MIAPPPPNNPAYILEHFFFPFTDVINGLIYIFWYSDSVLKILFRLKHNKKEKEDLSGSLGEGG